MVSQNVVRWNSKAGIYIENTVTGLFSSLVNKNTKIKSSPWNLCARSCASQTQAYMDETTSFAKKQQQQHDVAFNPNTPRTMVLSVLSSKLDLISNFRCYCRKKPLFSFPSVFGSQIQVFISSDIAQQNHNIRPHKTLQSDSTQALWERVLLEVNPDGNIRLFSSFSACVWAEPHGASWSEIQALLRAALPPSGRFDAKPGAVVAKQGTGTGTRQNWNPVKKDAKLPNRPFFTDCDDAFQHRKSSRFFQIYFHF